MEPTWSYLTADRGTINGFSVCHRVLCMLPMLILLLEHLRHLVSFRPGQDRFCICSGGNGTDGLIPRLGRQHNRGHIQVNLGRSFTCISLGYLYKSLVPDYYSKVPIIRRTHQVLKRVYGRQAQKCFLR
jgi:hypothetical protein